MKHIEVPKDWNDKHRRNIRLLINLFEKYDYGDLSSSFSSPIHLKQDIGQKSFDLILEIWDSGPKNGCLSNIVINLLIIHFFNNWNDETYQAKLQQPFIEFIEEFCDWWERPIMRKWFETKENLLDEFGKDIAEVIVGTILLHQLTTKGVNLDKTSINLKTNLNLDYYQIIDILRLNINGYKNVIKWKREYRKHLIMANSPLLIILTIFLIYMQIEYITLLFWSFVSIWFLIFFFLNIWIVLKNIDNMWYRIHFTSLFFIYLIYLILALLILPNISITINTLFFFALGWLGWVVSIVSFRKYQIDCQDFGKDGSHLGGNSIYFFLFSFFTWSILTYISDFSLFDTNFLKLFFIDEINNSSIIGIEIGAMINFILIYIFYIKPEFWIRRKEIKPFKTYKKLGILEDFMNALSLATNQDYSIIKKKLNLDKSITENYLSLGITFKGNINKAYNLLKNYETQLFNKVIPDSPEEFLLYNIIKISKGYDKKISNLIWIKRFDDEFLKLKFINKLPKNLIETLRSTELHFRLYSLYDERSFKICIIELASTIEYIFKIIINLFLQKTNMYNCLNLLKSSTDKKEKHFFIMLLERGVTKTTLGAFLRIIKDICFIQKDCKITHELGDFLDKNWPIDHNFLIELENFNRLRNSLVHTPGKIIDCIKYERSRNLIFEYLNHLRIDLSSINSPTF